MAKIKKEPKQITEADIAKQVASQEVDLTKQRMEKIAPIVKTILKMMVDTDLPVGDLTADDQTRYAEFAKSVLQLLLDNEVKYVDKDFLFQLMKQPIDQIQNVVLSSLARSFDTAINRALGKDFRDVTLKDLDGALKTKVAGN